MPNNHLYWADYYRQALLTLQYRMKRNLGSPINSLCILPYKTVNDTTFSQSYVTGIIKKKVNFVLRLFIKLKITLGMNNLTELRGNWKEIKAKLKLKFGMLTDRDLLFAEGKQDEMLGRLQTKLGRTKAEIHKIISDL
jgi:uncharacterized protein YjbJ (UPF0337 family)